MTYTGEDNRKEVLLFLFNCATLPFCDVRPVIKSLGLSRKEIIDLFSILEYDNLVNSDNKWRQYKISSGGTEKNLDDIPFNFRLTTKGENIVLLQNAMQRTIMDKKIDDIKMKQPVIKVFISHSSKDVEIAKRIIGLLRSSLNIIPSEILCTSVDGHKLDPGINTDERLKKEVHESKAFIGIITENSIKSSYVLFELGARWGANLPMVPIVCDNKGASILPGPLKNIHCLMHQVKGDIYSLVDSISKTLGINQMPTNSFLEEVEQITKYDPYKLNKEESDKLDHIETPQQGSNTTTVIPEEVNREIKSAAEKEWKDDYQMVVHTIKKQVKAYIEYKNYSAPDVEVNKLNRIIKSAEMEWPNDYEMILHTINKQVESIRELNKL